MTEKRKSVMLWRKWGLLAGVVLVGLVLVLNMLLIYRQYQIHLQEYPGALLRIFGKRELTAEVVKGDTLVQDFWLDRGAVTGFSLEFATYGKASQGNAQVDLYREAGDERLGQWTLPGGEIQDNQPHRFDIEVPIQVRNGGERFRLEVRSPNGTTGNSFAVYCTEKDLYREGTLAAKGVESTDLVLEVYQSDYPNVKLFFVLLALFSGGIYAVSCLYLRNVRTGAWQIPMERAVFCLILLLGTAYLFVMPPHSAPDEPAHFGTAYAYTNRLLGQEGKDEKGYAYVRKEDMIYNEAQKSPSAYSYQLFWEYFCSMAKDGEKTTFASRTVNGVWPLAYLPQIVGILLSRLLHLGGVPLFVLTRAMALLFYAVCGYQAVKRIPFAKGMLALALLLPISLELGASCSYDCTMLALSYLFAGEVWHCIYKKEQIVWKDWLLMAGIAVLVVPLKIVYWPLFALCLLIPAEKCTSVKSLWAGRVGVLGGGLLSLLAIRLSSMIYYLTRTSFYAAKGQWQGISMSDVLAHPAMAVRLLAESFRSQGDFYLTTMVGGRLGWLDTEIPDYLVYGFLFLLFLAAVKTAGEKQYIQAKARLLAAGLSAAVILAIFGVFLITWTAAGADRIDGVQGRYFLPVLPVLLPCLRSGRLMLRENMDNVLLFGAILLHIFVIWAAFQVNLLR